MARQVLPFPNAPIVGANGRLTEAWLRTMQRVHASAAWVETYVGVVGTLADVPTTLTNKDAGALIGLHAYQHLLQWTGDVWIFAPGDAGNGYLLEFAVGLAPVAPGWALCDGSTTDLLVVGGASLATRPYVMPVIPNTYLRR